MHIYITIISLSILKNYIEITKVTILNSYIVDLLIKTLLYKHSYLIYIYYFLFEYLNLYINI